MIGNALRVEIERSAERLRQTLPLFVRAQEGTLTAVTITRYLTNVRELIHESPPLLARARDRARGLGDVPLAEFFGEKVREEVGHHEWATNDLERVSSQTRISADTTVLPGVEAMIAFQRDTIDEDPTLYLSYTLFAEYLTVLLGPWWLELLETRCGIPISSMTVVANHVATDKDHVEETLESIDALVTDPRKLHRMREVLAGSIACFERFAAEITDDDSGFAREVSAA
jgi:hypothetical protein